MVKILCVIGSFVAYEVIWDFDAMLDDRGGKQKAGCGLSRLSHGGNSFDLHKPLDNFLSAFQNVNYRRHVDFSFTYQDFLSTF